MTMTITVEEAQIRTAAVEIKTMTVNGRQVTLSLFRQLKDEDLIEDTDAGFVLKGQAWGVVNYHPDAVCAKAAQHLHVVWQAGDELRRALVPWRWDTGVTYEDLRQWAADRVRRERPELKPYTPELKQAQDAYLEEDRVFAKATQDAYLVLYHQLEALPQLFIAV